ncbi:MAG: hypothetical protein COA52_15465 [Hyphomicrobiales bacterium]|nr:hypothetical protein [Hyphomicrobiales bacterium]PCJ86147.1 MAG: hypothetical protein COA52_15465 [Hyphomicrobiales bacterium]
MLAKILVLIGIMGLVYVITQRQKLLGKLFNPEEKGLGQTVDVADNTIEELEKDPETGRYMIKSKKPKK